MDSSLRTMDSNYEVCREFITRPSKDDLHPWVFQSTAWSCNHTDLTASVSGHTELAIVVVCSKFPETGKLKTIPSSATMILLQEMYSQHGVPEMIVCGN